MSWKNKHQNIIFICRGGIKLMFFMCAFMKFPLFFNTKRYFYTKKKKKFFFSPDPWFYSSLTLALPVSSTEDVQLSGRHSAPDEEWRLRKSSNKGLISNSLPPAAATTPRKCGEVSLPRTSRRANLRASPLFSFPPHLHPSQSISAPAVGALRRCREWGGGARGPGELVAGRSPRRLVRDWDVTQPSCSPGAPPLLPSASSRSPQHPQVTVGPCQFHPQVQASSTPAPFGFLPQPRSPLKSPSVLASFILKSKLVFSFAQDFFGWSHSVASWPVGSQELKPALGSAFKSPEVDSSSKTILSLCSPQVVIPIHTLQIRVCKGPCTSQISVFRGLCTPPLPVVPKWIFFCFT